MEYTIGQKLENKREGGTVRVLEVFTNTIVISSGEVSNEPLGLFSYEQIERDYNVV